MSGSPHPDVGRELATCTAPLVAGFDVGLFDLDGVLYLGDQAVPHAAPSIQEARNSGLRIAFVTNNASRSPTTVAEHLRALGVAAGPHDVVTSAQAAARLLGERLAPGARVLVLGTQALADEVTAAGLVPVRDAHGQEWDATSSAGTSSAGTSSAGTSPAGTAAGGVPVAVVQGLSQDLGWRELAEACVVLAVGALWVSGNSDVTLPSPRGPLPGNGALVAALAAATGRQPVVAGKPEPALHRESVGRTGARRPLVVGDRLDTDIVGAVRAGTPSLLVLTGVTDRTRLLEARLGERPSYVSADLRGLLRAHAPVVVDDGSARCGPATARWAGESVVVDGAAEDSDDGLRVACALAWQRLDEG